MTPDQEEDEAEREAQPPSSASSCRRAFVSGKETPLSQEDQFWLSSPFSSFLKASASAASAGFGGGVPKTERREGAGGGQEGGFSPEEREGRRRPGREKEEEETEMIQMLKTMKTRSAAPVEEDALSYFHYRTGDASRPSERPPCAILHLVDASASWLTGRGFFRALDQLGPAPRSHVSLVGSPPL